ncbi:MAG: MaoC family dehydratase [Acidimicrobiia bacterium]
MSVVSVAEMPGLVGRELGPSTWVEVGQDKIDTFADVTSDHQFIHVDHDLAAQTPFGTTIAHGFLTLSLLTAMCSEFVVSPQGAVMGINYGLDKVRFLAPVKSGSQVRARGRITEVGERSPGRWLVKYEVTVEIEGEDKPALLAEWLTMSVVA